MAVRCPNCGKILPITPDMSGRNVQCLGCGHRFRVPRERADTPPNVPPFKTLRVACPHCNGLVIDEGSLRGQMVACAYCNQQFRMPIALDTTSEMPEPPVKRQQVENPIPKPPPIIQPSAVESDERFGKINTKNNLKVFGQSLLKRKPLIIASAVIGFVILFDNVPRPVES